jgi:DNA-binding response OmpR family regulator
MADSGVREPQRLRVLIVEDEALIGMMLEDLIEDLGHRVATVAASVRSALDAIAVRDGEIDAAVVDANLGGASASPVVAALSHAGIPFVIASGYDPSKLLRLGIGSVSLRKPQRRSDVELALRDLAAAAAPGASAPRGHSGADERP